MTETNEKDYGMDESKKSQKIFKLPVKASSPQIKKNITTEYPLTNGSKLCFSNNAAKIKRVKKPIGIYEKMNTETGPLLQRYQPSEKEKTLPTN